MNFDYSDDQKLLKEEARKILVTEAPPERCRAVMDDAARPHDETLWATLAELGWLGLPLPEAHGGLGMGPVELCAFAEELGRVVAPIPFSTTLYLFAEALKLAGSEAQQARAFPEIANGAFVGTIAVDEAPGREPGAMAARVEGGKLSGIKLPVIDGATVSQAIVLAADGDGESLFLVDLTGGGVSHEPLHTLDQSRKAARLVFDGAPAERLGEAGAGRALLRRIEDRAAVFLTFEQIGGADRCLEMARDYALERYAFGRPIGSYQAIKHKLADMFIRNQLARSNAYFAASALLGDAASLTRAAAAARVAACEAYWFASKELIEIFGGIGTTWEADCHLHYRRAKHLALLVGAPALWKDRLAQALVDDLSETLDGPQ